LRATLPADRRLKVAILNIPLYLMTKRAASVLSDDPESFIAVLDWQALSSMFKARPTRALDASFRKYVLGNAFYGDLTTFWNERVLDGPWHCGMHPTSARQVEATRAYCRFEHELQPDGFVNWDLAARGFNTLAERRQALSSGNRGEADLRRGFEREQAKLARKLDLLGLDFDDDRIDRVLEVARELRPFTDRVVFLLCPEHPWMHRSEAAEARVQRLIERFETASLTVLDLRHQPTFAPTDFADATHIRYAESEKYSTTVAAAVSAVLAGESNPRPTR